MLNLPTLANIVAAVRTLLQAHPYAAEPNLHQRTHAAGNAADVATITADRPFIAITYEGTTSQPPANLSQPTQLSTDTFAIHIIGSRAAKDAQATGGNLADDLMKIRNHIIQLLIAKKLLPRYFATQMAATSPPADITPDGLGIAVSFAFPFFFCPGDGYDLAEIDLQRIVVEGTPENPANHPIIPAVPVDNTLLDIAAFRQGDYGDNTKAMVFDYEGVRYLAMSRTAMSGNTPIEELAGQYRVKRTGGNLPTITTAARSLRILSNPPDLPPEWTVLGEWENNDSTATATASAGAIAHEFFDGICLTCFGADINGANPPSVFDGGYLQLEQLPQSPAAPAAITWQGIPHPSSTQFPNLIDLCINNPPAFTINPRDNVHWRISRRTGIANAVLIEFPDLPPPLTNPFANAPNFTWTLQRTQYPAIPAIPAVKIPQADIDLTP